MPKKQNKKGIKKEILEALRNAIEDIEDITIEGNYLEIPLEIADSPDYNTIEAILKRYGYVISHITRYTAVFRRHKGEVNW